MAYHAWYTLHRTESPFLDQIKFPTATEDSPLAHVDFELCELLVGVGPFPLEKSNAVFYPVDFTLELIGEWIEVIVDLYAVDIDQVVVGRNDFGTHVELGAAKGNVPLARAFDLRSGVVGDATWSSVTVDAHAGEANGVNLAKGQCPFSGSP
ncbi:hypothetical protein N7494_011867 [Penicillium frequentans]|uniref:Uncharacterized protein n=1 Tax=Penicillium frequentans TaxID=3151616 RepID=A0AAD6GAK3_9EURO|nr:hypothetical protein N7494_011867 [Penicillium glabrum]